MKHRGKKLKENVSILANTYRPNYAIRPLGAMNVNDRTSLDAGWINKRVQEEEMRNQYSYMIGNLDNADKMFIQLFQQMTDLKNFIEKQREWPLLSSYQSKIIGDISKKLDTCNSIIVTEVIPLIDKLGTDLQGDKDEMPDIEPEMEF